MRLGAPVPSLNDAVQILADDGIIRVIHYRCEPSRVFLGAQTFEAKAELLRNGRAGVDLAALENVRRIVVGHELANDLSPYKNRNERQRGDALGSHHRFQLLRHVDGLLHVIDAYRTGVGVLGFPGRMTVNGPAVFV